MNIDIHFCIFRLITKLLFKILEFDLFSFIDSLCSRMFIIIAIRN